MNALAQSLTGSLKCGSGLPSKTSPACPVPMDMTINNDNTPHPSYVCMCLWSYQHARTSGNWRDKGSLLRKMATTLWCSCILCSSSHSASLPSSDHPLSKGQCLFFESAYICSEYYIARFLTQHQATCTPSQYMQLCSSSWSVMQVWADFNQSFHSSIILLLISAFQSPSLSSEPEHFATPFYSLPRPL